MIHQTTGRWGLSACWIPCFCCCKRRSGRYSLDKESMQLQVDGQTVAQLVIQRISDVPLTPRPCRTCFSVANVDASEIMWEVQNPANAGAFFVLPSQLNGVEYPDNRTVISSIQMYMWDGTAGPRGQLAVHPAVGQFLLDNAACSGRSDGINAVNDVLKAMIAEGHTGFTVENGYLRVPRMSDAKAKAACIALEQNLGLLKTIAALDVPASGLNPELSNWSSASHSVNVVYASAAPVGAYNNPGGDRVQEISSLLIRGAYFGAIRLALERHKEDVDKKTKVFCVPLGGGVFNNSRRSIAQSFIEAVDLADGLCEPGELVRKLDLRLLTFAGKPSESVQFTQLLCNAGLHR